MWEYLWRRAAKCWRKAQILLDHPRSWEEQRSTKSGSSRIRNEILPQNPEERIRRWWSIRPTGFEQRIESPDWRYFRWRKRIFFRAGLSRRWFERTSGGRGRRPAIEEQLEKVVWQKNETKLWIENICWSLSLRRTYIDDTILRQEEHSKGLG